MNVVYSHLDSRRRKTERFRRKALESLYHELIGMEVFDLTMESRTPSQDASDRAHIVGLRNQGLDGRLHIDHLRGGDEPLLWVADAVLGAINAEHLGNDSFITALRTTLVVEERTPDSLEPSKRKTLDPVVRLGFQGLLPHPSQRGALSTVLAQYTVGNA